MFDTAQKWERSKIIQLVDLIFTPMVKQRCDMLRQIFLSEFNLVKSFVRQSAWPIVLLVFSASICFNDPELAKGQDVLGLNGMTGSDVVKKSHFLYGRMFVAVLRNKEIQKELEILEYQAKEITEYENKLSKELSKLQKINYEQFLDDQDQVRFQHANVEMYMNSHNQLLAFAKETLLPVQVKELERKLIWGIVNRSNSLIAVFEVPRVKSLLELNSGELEKLQLEHTKLQEEFDKELNTLRIKYREKLIDSLPNEKKRLFQREFGEPLTFGTIKIGF